MLTFCQWERKYMKQLAFIGSYNISSSTGTAFYVEFMVAIGQGKKFFKVREMSGNFILGQGKLEFWRKVRENWNCNTDLVPSKVKRNISGQMSAKDSCYGRLEVATISENLHLFGQGNLTFIREKSVNFENLCLWQPYWYYGSVWCNFQAANLLPIRI